MSVATYAAAQLLRLVPRSGLSKVVGKLCERPLSPGMARAVTNLYIRAYGVDMTEVEHAAEYECFDSFFTRPLRSDARIISRDAVVSPADGKLVARGPIASSAVITVKRTPYDVGELIGDSEEAARLIGGSFAVVYLSPRDYHRVHSPVDGRITLVRGIAGDLFPVNAIGERHVPWLFVKNQRVTICIETDDLGRVFVVLVGAMIVGRVSVTAVPSNTTPLGTHRIEPALPVSRGDEIGMFHLGSTVVLLAGPGVALDRNTGKVLFGESLLSPRTPR